MKPLVIAVDGLDGGGKTTLIAALKVHLEGLGHTTVVIPYLGPGFIRQAVIQEKDLEPFHRLILLRVAADIAIKKCEDALALGHFVLFDRAVDSFYAYQGYGDGLINMIEPLDKFFEKSFTPDLTFLLDIPVKLSRERVLSRGHALDDIESREDAYFERVRNGFLIRHQLEQDRICLIDATMSAKKVALDATLYLDWVLESVEE